MNYNASLDDIIKQNRSKVGLKTKKFRNNKNANANAKPAFRSNIKKKQSPPIFKAKFKKRKTPDVTDARVKILQNKKKSRGKSVGSMRSPLLQGKILQDARLKIEAHRQKLKVSTNLTTRRGAAITRMAPNGILQRRINPNLIKDNGIRVEYEHDSEMSLENETFPPTRGWPDQFSIRRTVNNAPERKRLPPTLMGYRDLDAEPDESMFYNPRDTLPLNEVTRTFTNLRASPTYRKSYSSRLSSPLRQTEDMRDISLPKSSREREMREPCYYRIMISNLHENVTSEDIKELFEDIGDLVHAKMVRDGTAEVAYKYEDDARKAVEAYHNRLLDGIPMRCTLLNNSEISSMKKRHPRIPPVSTHSSIEPDAHIIKKALFNN